MHSRPPTVIDASWNSKLISGIENTWPGTAWIEPLSQLLGMRTRVFSMISSATAPSMPLTLMVHDLSSGGTLGGSALRIGGPKSAISGTPGRSLSNWSAGCFFSTQITTSSP
jgi:hypothetical protein